MEERTMCLMEVERTIVKGTLYCIVFLGEIF